MQFSIDIHAGSELDGYDEADDYRHEARDLAAEVERLRGDAECLASNRREVSRLVGDVERLTHSRNVLQGERDEARAEVSRLNAELAKSREKADEVVWACPVRWKVYYYVEAKDLELYYHGGELTREVFSQTSDSEWPKPGRYKIVAPGRAVLVK